MALTMSKTGFDDGQNSADVNFFFWMQSQARGPVELRSPQVSSQGSLSACGPWRAAVTTVGVPQPGWVRQLVIFFYPKSGLARFRKDVVLL